MPDPTVGGTLRGVVETLHSPAFRGRTFQAEAYPDGTFDIRADPLKGRCDAVWSAFAAGMDATAFGGPLTLESKTLFSPETRAAVDAAMHAAEPPALDLSSHGGDLAVCADRMRAVVAARRAAAVAATDWQAKYFDLVARYESLADRYAQRCVAGVAAREADPAALIARLTCGDEPVVVEGRADA